MRVPLTKSSPRSNFFGIRRVYDRIKPGDEALKAEEFVKITRNVNNKNK